MTTPLLTTKLHIPPLLPDRVPRLRLIRRLDEGLRSGNKLTLVSAPAGYGKTTLVAEWLRHLQDAGDAAPAVSWLSLDEGDSDPARFWAYLIAALQMVDPAIGQTAQAMLHSPQPPPPESLLTALINEIAATPRSFVLVLDDYHLIEALPIHQQLTFLVEHQPVQMRLVVATREDPPLPLSRLRARGQTVEIRQDDLRFSREECADFLKSVMALDLSQDDIAALERRTEGWIAGLQMAALSLQHTTDSRGFVQSFTGSHRYILDYLIEEVLSKQPSHLQDFLLETAILDRLSASLSDAVTQRSDSHEVLQHLEAANVFIVPLDPGRHWYRFHHLFTELLRHRLRLTPRISEETLHRRASHWFEQNQYPFEAVQHALAAVDWDRSAQLIHTEAEGMLKRGEVTTLLGWLKKLPEEQVTARPRLSLDFSWPLIMSGQLETAERLLTHAEQQADKDPHVLGEIAAAQAYIARSRGDDQRTVAMSQRALSLLPETDVALRELLAVNLGIAHWHNGQLEEADKVLNEAWRLSVGLGNRYAEMTIQVFLNRVLAARGLLQQAYQAYQPLVELEDQVPILALAHLDLSALHYEWNNLEACAAHLEKSIAVSERTRNGEFQISGHIQMARLRLAYGDVNGAVKALHRAEQLLQVHSVTPLTRARNAAAHVQVALFQGDLPGASAWARDAGDHADVHPFYPFLGLSRARLLLAQNRQAEALDCLKDRFEIATRAGWGYGQIVVRVLQAAAAGQPEDALDFLIQALTWAGPGGFIRTFVDAGGALAPLLEEAALRGVMPEYVGTLLAALGGQAKVQRLTKATGVSPLVEPLSEREIEVLRLVAAGLSNREIAKKLVISTGTAKTHIHNLCGKLGVRNRTEAATRAKELGLV